MGKISNALVLPAISRLRFALRRLIHWRRAVNGSVSWSWPEQQYNRIALVNYLVSQKPQCCYLEIGCFNDDLFHAVYAANKIGVDPVKGGTIRATSDVFFARCQDQFDVVFIDGLHTYEQVRRDVLNSIRCMRAGGWIALHDMLPTNWTENYVPRVTADSWTGDVWKVAFELMLTEGLDFRIIDIDHGVGLCYVSDPNAVFTDQSAELSKQDFSYYLEYHKLLPVIDWGTAVSWIDSYRT